MSGETLGSRVTEFEKNKAKLRLEADQLAVELATAISERLLELFEKRDGPRSSFENWLGSQFIADPYVNWDIFTQDLKLNALVKCVDMTQDNRSKVASLVNTDLLKVPSWLGVNRSFVDVTVIGVQHPA